MARRQRGSLCFSGDGGFVWRGRVSSGGCVHRGGCVLELRFRYAGISAGDTPLAFDAFHTEHTALFATGTHAANLDDGVDRVGFE